MSGLRGGTVDTARVEAREIAKSVQLYEQQTGALPATLSALTESLCDDPRLVSQGAATVPRMCGPLMDKVPRDPWGGEYVLLTETASALPFVVLSPGPDGRLWTGGGGLAPARRPFVNARRAGRT